jgi:hypothetical protein
MTDWRRRAREIAAEEGFDPDVFERQIDQESGFNPAAYNPSGASGIAQIIPRWHPGVDVWNPEESLRYAARWLTRLVARYDGSYKHALAAYNWGPGNADQWDGSRSKLPAETRHYLDVILGSGWPNPAGSRTAPKFVVAGTDGLGLRMREGPSLTANIVGLIAEGVTVVGESYAWRRVTIGNQTVWVADEFLREQP